jgi:hypothetical protein
MHSKNTRYLLFLFGNYRGGEKLIESITTTFTPVISNDYLKFIWGDNGAVIHFESDLPFSEVSDFITLQLGGMIEQYFLMEATENILAQGPDDTISYLMDLDTEIRRPEPIDENLEKEEEFDRVIKYFMENYSEPKDFEFTFDNMEDLDDEDNEIDLIKMRYSRDNVLTLDQLLDKITEKGIKSLSKKEKQQLEKYANGK